MTAFFKEIEPFRGNGNENEKGQTLEEFLEEYDPYKYKNPCVHASCLGRGLGHVWPAKERNGVLKALAHHFLITKEDLL